VGTYRGQLDANKKLRQIKLLGKEMTHFTFLIKTVTSSKGYITAKQSSSQLTLAAVTESLINKASNKSSNN